MLPRETSALEPPIESHRNGQTLFYTTRYVRSRTPTGLTRHDSPAKFGSQLLPKFIVQISETNVRPIITITFGARPLQMKSSPELTDLALTKART